MNEKMTDEELEQALESMLKGFMQARRKVRAHIAALTAERDEWRQAHDTLKTNHENLGTMYRGGCTDRDALRERVQALEAQCTKLAQERDAEWTTRRAAESRLAAIRQPVREAMDLLGESSDNVTKAWLLLNAALDDTRPSAPPEAFTHEKGLDAGVFEEAAKGCGLCPGCTDENWADGDLCDAATARDMERTDYKAPPAMDVLSTPTATDPTTSDAFATVREAMALFEAGDRDDVNTYYATRDALSLLERRMGAQDKALRMVLKIAGEGSMFTQGERDALRFALTDAPLVFTLGEVKEALTEHIGDLPEAVNEVMDRLTAMRK